MDAHVVAGPPGAARVAVAAELLRRGAQVTLVPLPDGAPARDLRVEIARALARSGCREAMDRLTVGPSGPGRLWHLDGGDPRGDAGGPHDDIGGPHLDGGDPRGGDGVPGAVDRRDGAAPLLVGAAPPAEPAGTLFELAAALRAATTELLARCDGPLRPVRLPSVAGATVLLADSQEYAAARVDDRSPPAHRVGLQHLLESLARACALPVVPAAGETVRAGASPGTPGAAERLVAHHLGPVLGRLVVTPPPDTRQPDTRRPDAGRPDTRPLDGSYVDPAVNRVMLAVRASEQSRRAREGEFWHLGHPGRARGGPGRPVLVIANALHQDIRLWHRLRASLAGRHRVVMWSPPTDPGCGPAEQEAALRRSISELDGDPYVLLGWCSGAKTAVRLAAHGAPGLQHLVLVGASFRHDGEPELDSAYERNLDRICHEIIRRPAAARLLPALMATTAPAGDDDTWPGRPARHLTALLQAPFRDRARAQNYARQLLRFWEDDVLDDCARVEISVTTVIGDADSVVPARRWERDSSLFPAAKALVVPAASHYVMDDRPQVLADIL